jgi:hypothetical protein
MVLLQIVSDLFLVFLFDSAKSFDDQRCMSDVFVKKRAMLGKVSWFGDDGPR